ncbi:MAG TPA: acyltransferase [Reyranella sp.]|nr:acyltransferase [Reyranella sp.]
MSAGPGRLAYLDGLRGWMALVVVLHHLFASWLMAPAELRRHGAGWVASLFKWTPLGSATDGLQAVFIFFAISGVALTYPVLRSARRDRTLAGMAVWRYPRLAVPVLASCAVAFLLTLSGAMANQPAAAHLVNGAWWAEQYAFPTDLSQMLTFALWETFTPLQATMHSWNPPLWTMAPELRGSFLLFLLLAVVRWRWLRLCVAGVLIVLWVGAYIQGFLTGFLVGYCLAELLVAAERSPLVQERMNRARPLGWLCLAGALLASTALQIVSFEDSRNEYILPMNLVAILTIVSVVLLAPLQRWLSAPLSRFLGRLSFGLYLTHVPLICSFSSALLLATVDRLPYWLVVTVVGGLSLVAAIAVAWLFTVLVEERLLGWLKRCVMAIVHPAFDTAYNSVRSSVLRILP